MKKEEKIKIVQDLADKISQCNSFYITDATGFTVKDVTDFRILCYKSNVEYLCAKNTLIKKALQNLKLDSTQLLSALKGSSSIIFNKQAGSVPAKILSEFGKKNGKRPLLKVAWIDSETYLGDKQLEYLKKLKSKEELVADVIFLLQSPARKIVSALTNPGRKLAGAIKTLAEKK